MSTQKPRRESNIDAVGADWWRTFFGRETGDLMFDHFVPGLAKRDVDEIVRRTRVRAGVCVLDVGCGRGRHSLELARRGFRVVAVDYSRSYIAEARRMRSDLHNPSLLRLVRGDMRTLGHLLQGESFDLVLSLFNSFGYFASRREDLHVLRQFAQALKPGGVLVISTISRSGVEANVGAQRTRNWTEFKPAEFFLDQSAYDARRARLSVHWTLVRARDRHVRRFAYAQNVYSREELTHHLRRVGLVVESVWGSLGTGRRFRSDAWDMTIVARKEGRTEPERECST